MSYSSLRFLVVDDGDLQQRTLVRYLEALGAKDVHTAGEGAAALRIVQTAQPPIDIIVCDVQLPGMDGLEFIRRLHENDCTAALILASALERRLLGSIATMTQAYGLRLLGAVEKPLTSGKLQELVAKCRPTNGARDQPHQTGPCFSVDDILEGLHDGQFEPYFQPKLEIASEQVCGVEALARWRHPQHGIVAPNAFVPVLEDSGGMDELTRVMLRKSAAACAALTQRGHALLTCVNLSVASLSDTALVNELSQIVSEEGVEPSQIVFEITESAASTQIAGALENLARMRMRGFGLSIDDFGTGYSSMQQLARIAFTELKIDRAFVTNAGSDSAARVILGSSLDMARRLDIMAVAEGVETEDDLELLRDLDCGLAQGYLISRPMEASALHGWIDDWKRDHR